MPGKTLYLDRTAAVLAREGGRFVIRDRDRSVIQEIPVFDVEGVVLIGNVQITGAALDLIIDREIETVFLSRRGRFKARIETRPNHFAALRLAQYAHVVDPDRRLETARRIVAGKLQNMRTALMRRRKNNPDLDTSIGRIELAIDRVDSAGDNDSLRGIEGSGSKAYFEGFRLCLRQDLGFRKRARRPPPDPVNALLSFGYTILYQYVEAALRRTGLDPYLGYLHETADRKPALSLDMMEEYRPLIVDSVVLALVNRVQLTGSDFVDTGSGHHLKPDSLARFVAALESRLDENTGAVSSEATSYRQAMLDQARQLARIVQGKLRTPYRPLSWR